MSACSLLHLLLLRIVFNRPETTLEITHNLRFSATKNASSAMNETNTLLVKI